MRFPKKPFSNLQKELPELYEQGVSDEDLLTIKRLLAHYFADRASDEMDRLWKERNWSDETMKKWLAEGPDES